MADFIIIDGDTAQFLPMFGQAIVIPQPGTISGSGPMTLNGKKVCIEGDESSVAVRGCMYMTPDFPIPGVGTLKIDSLSNDQKAQHSNNGDTPLILKGSQFNAVFEVQSPAIKPGIVPTPDATPSYGNGQGFFVTTNFKFKAT